MKNIPELRFPEFKNAPKWEEKKLGDLLDYEQPTNYLVSDTNYNDSFEIPVLTAGKTFILGYTNETHGIFQNPLPVIIFDDFTTATQFVDFPFKAKSSAMKILKPKDDFGNIKIIFELMQTIEYQANEHKRYWISEYQNLEIKLPSLIEQQKIADCLSSVDSLISAQSQKVELLKEHKKALMQQLFPQDGEEVPKLRFPEFKNAPKWEEKTLGDVGKVSMCKRIMKDETTETGEIPFYKIGTFGKKADAYIDKELYEDYRKKYSFPKKGDILISASGTIGRLVVYDGLPAYFQDSNIVWIDNNEELVKNSFLSFFYETVKWTTSDTTIARLYNDNLRSVQILIPSIKEQQKIADCLNSVDEQISSQSQKLQTLKEHKKGLMQQLFPSKEV